MTNFIFVKQPSLLFKIKGILVVFSMSQKQVILYSDAQL